ncbi:MAG: phosphatidate cytidylyltransferase [Candidatus Acidiferrales bacterium]
MTLKRILTAVVLIPIVVGIVLWSPPGAVAVLAGLVLFMALWEFFRITDALGLRAYRRWTLACAMLVVAAQWAAGRIEIRAIGFGWNLVRNSAEGLFSLEGVFLLFIFGAGTIVLATRRELAETLPALGASCAGLLLIALPFSYVVRLDGIDENGPRLVLFTLALIWAGDMAAYFVGRSMGRFRMAPAISPKKTWEGAAANFVASLLVGALFARWMDTEALPLLVIAGLANIAGQAGDLVESAYKRGANMKDSGEILPGHGGMLDRIDSLIFAAPVVWCYFGWLGRPLR